MSAPEIGIPRRREYLFALAALLLAAIWSTTGGDQVDALTADAIAKDPPRAGFKAPCPDLDERGRPLRASVDDWPENRCYYGRD